MLILLIALTGLGAAVAFALLTRSPAQALEFTPVAVNSTAAARLDAKIATVHGADAPVSIEIDDEEATSKLAETLASDPALPTIENPQVHFRDGQIFVSGIYRDGPVPVSILMVGRIEARDGRLFTTIDRIDTGRFPLPDSMKGQLTDYATDINHLNNRLPITVTEVHTLDGRLVVAGQPK